MFFFFFVWIQITIWGYFLSAWRISFSSSCKVALLATNSVFIYQNVFILPTFFEIYFYWIYDFGLIVFSFEHFEYVVSSYCLLASIVSDELLILLVFSWTWQVISCNCFQSFLIAFLHVYCDVLVWISLYFSYLEFIEHLGCAHCLWSNFVSFQPLSL